MTTPITGSLVLSDDEGSYPALSGMVPAETGRRVLGRVIEAVFGAISAVLPYVILGGWFVNYAYSYDGGSGMGGFYGALVAAFAAPVVLLIAQIYCWVKKGNHVGGAILGLVNVDVTTGERAPGKTVLKNLLVNMTSGFTFLIMPLVLCFGTIKGSTMRNAYDRWTGVMVVDTKKGAGPRQPGAEPVSVQQPIQDQRRPIEQISLGATPNAHPVPQAPAVFQAPVTPSNPIMAPTQLAAPAPSAPAIPSASPVQPARPNFSDPFSAGPSTSASPSIHPVAKPGAGSFIESTPFASKVPQPEVRSPEPPVVPRGFTPMPTPPRMAPPASPMPVMPSEQPRRSAPVPEPIIAPEPHVEPALPNVEETVVDASAFTPSRAAATTQVVLDGQSVISLERITLIGRNPSAVPSLSDTDVLALPDPNMEISKTHLAIGADDGDWWVMDLRSTNGTRVVDPAGQETKLEPGKRTTVPAGGKVRFGSHEIKATA